MAALWLSAGWCEGVSAQTIGPLIREPEDVPGQRVIPEYAPIGFDLAGFDALPSVSFGIRADDNLFTRTSRKEADVALQVEPRLRLLKRERFNTAFVEASARSSSYLRLPDQDALEYRLEGTYTRGSNSLTSASLNLGYRREAVQRGTAENDLIGGEPLMRRVLHTSITGRKQFSRLAINAQALFVKQNFEQVKVRDGAIIEQRFRNVDHYGLHALASYEISGRSALYGSAELDHFDYARSPTLNNRDADNLSATVGIRYELTKVLYAQVAVGYRKYDFEDPALGAVKGLAVSAHLRYFPSRLLAVRGLVEQINTTSPYDLVGAVTLTSARVEAEYEMRRSLSWLGAVKFTLEDYARQDYAARRLDFSAGPRLRFSRWLSASANVAYSRRFVTGPAPFEPYSQFIGFISVTLSR